MLSLLLGCLRRKITKAECKAEDTEAAMPILCPSKLHKAHISEEVTLETGSLEEEVETRENLLHTIIILEEGNRTTEEGVINSLVAEGEAGLAVAVTINTNDKEEMKKIHLWTNTLSHLFSTIRGVHYWAEKKATTAKMEICTSSHLSCKILGEI